MAQRRLPRVREAPATMGLIACFGLVFLVTFAFAVVERPTAAVLWSSLWSLSSAQALERTGGLVMTRIWLDGEWWRVVTAGFVHGSWLHLGLNAWGFWVVGQWTERVWGPARQLAVFMIGSIGGCLASLAWVEAPIVVGASAGIFAIAAALVVARLFGTGETKRVLGPVAGGRLAFWLVLWLVVGWQLPMLANAGHLGGACVGVVAGVGLTREWWGWRLLCWGLITTLCAGLALVGARPSWRPNYHAFTGFALLEREDVGAAIPELEAALRMNPEDPVLENAVAYSLALSGENLERAEELVLRALSEEPDQPDYLDTLGWVYCRMGRVDEGLARLAEAAAASSVPIPEVDEHLAACGSAAIR